MGKSIKDADEVKSPSVRFGKRTYFFDVNLTSSKQKYLRITESRFLEEGQPRMYNSFILFPENMAEFQKSMAEAAGLLA